MTFNLGSYYFDILYWNGKVLVPFPVLNLLFCSTNLANMIFNGDEFCFIYQTATSDVRKEIRKSSLNGTSCPKDVRKASINGLLFTMDYFYGLRDYKDLDDGFINHISEETLDSLWSEDPDEYNSAYLKMIQKGLNDLHTNLQYASVYDDESKAFDIYADDVIGDRWLSYYSSKAELSSQYESTFGDEEPVRFYDNTAFIKFNTFVVASNDELYGQDGSLKSDAWKYDTFYFMDKCMSDIASHSDIDNVVIDLTTNGGGTIRAMFYAVGFLTDKDVKYARYNTLTEEFRKDYYAIDADDDGSYTDEDAYSQFKWHILSSSNTFSAANAMTSICKNMGIATIIGETSGGGMCSVMPCSLMDGTTYRIGSNNSIRYPWYNKKTDKTIYQEIESGISPDYSIDRSEFYDLEYISDYINSGYEA